MTIVNFSPAEPKIYANCSICMAPLEEEVIAHKSSESKVLHCFHEHCLKQRALKDLSCPLCKYKIIIENNPSDSTPASVASAPLRKQDPPQNRLLRGLIACSAFFSRMSMFKPLVLTNLYPPKGFDKR